MIATPLPMVIGSALLIALVDQAGDHPYLLQPPGVLQVLSAVLVNHRLSLPSLARTNTQAAYGFRRTTERVTDRRSVGTIVRRLHPDVRVSGSGGSWRG